MAIRHSLIHNTHERITTKPEGPKVWNKHHGNAPAGAIYIGRGSPWGNPFKIGEHVTREEVIAKFEQLVQSKPELHDVIKRELKGRHLVCFCAPKACHGDVLLRIAND